MEAAVNTWIGSLGLPAVIAIMAGCIVALGKGADMLVDEAVSVARRWGVPHIIIGATVVSLGTTLPEAAVSVYAAFTGNPGIALGNAVGSIICDTGLVLGLATLVAPPTITSAIIHRQGWLQLGAGVLLVVACIPPLSVGTVFAHGGVLPQFMGMVFLCLLAAYLWMSMRWMRNEPSEAISEEEEMAAARGIVSLFRFVGAMVLVLVSSRLLIPAVQVSALRIGVPESIVGATIVAFGTSLPELVTALTAVRRGHGELAVGNVIGADILNVLFVAGAAASVTSGGLTTPAYFFQTLFPAMLLVLFIFRAALHFSDGKLRRPVGALLLSVYLLVAFYSYSTRII
jgi:cation:H+ antiporter